MELGKVQKAWVASLRKHPERQTTAQLGEGNPQNYKACCLGEALCVIARLNKKKLPFINGLIREPKSKNYLDTSYEKFGLIDEKGSIKVLRLKGENNLAAANDMGATWTEIADFIETNPKAVFTKSV